MLIIRHTTLPFRDILPYLPLPHANQQAPKTRNTPLIPCRYDDSPAIFSAAPTHMYALIHTCHQTPPTQLIMSPDALGSKQAAACCTCVSCSPRHTCGEGYKRFTPGVRSTYAPRPSSPAMCRVSSGRGARRRLATCVTGDAGRTQGGIGRGGECERERRSERGTRGKMMKERIGRWKWSTRMEDGKRRVLYTLHDPLYRKHRESIQVTN